MTERGPEDSGLPVVIHPRNGVRLAALAAPGLEQRGGRRHQLDGVIHLVTGGLPIGGGGLRDWVFVIDLLVPKSRRRIIDPTRPSAHPMPPVLRRTPPPFSRSAPSV